jgi:hypothetical protein
VNGDVADRLGFPATPEDMHELLVLEAALKQARCFTHVSINGYLTIGGEHGAIEGRIPRADWITA